jgi:curli production assembly/transport component CsgF
MKTIFLIVCLFGISIFARAQDLVYKPINPAFGGDTFNYQWLLSAAEAQNVFKAANTNAIQQKSQLQLFTDNLNNQLLGQVSNSLFQKQFGTNGISPGSYVFGSLSVDIYPSNLGLVVNILDTTTGEQTQVVVPGK